MQEGETVFEQGDIGHTFYVIMTGMVSGMAKSEEIDAMGYDLLTVVLSPLNINIFLI